MAKLTDQLKSSAPTRTPRASELFGSQIAEAQAKAQEALKAYDDALQAVRKGIEEMEQGLQDVTAELEAIDAKIAQY